MRTPEEIAKEVFESWKSEWTMNPKNNMANDTIWLEGYYPDPTKFFATAIEQERQHQAKLEAELASETVTANAFRELIQLPELQKEWVEKGGNFFEVLKRIFDQKQQSEQQLSQAEARAKELEQEILKWEQLVRKRDRAFDKYAEERTRISDEA